jgi:hypothetical protein
VHALSICNLLSVPTLCGELFGVYNFVTIRRSGAHVFTEGSLIYDLRILAMWWIVLCAHFRRHQNVLPVFIKGSLICDPRCKPVTTPAHWKHAVIVLLTHVTCVVVVGGFSTTFEV